MSSRGLAPVIGIVLLVAVTILLAASIVAFLTFGPTDGEMRQASIEGTILVGETSEITLEHAGGDTLQVDRIDLFIEVDGEPLEHQPPLPYWEASGFARLPTGPFNGGSSNDWEPGERGTIYVQNNTPQPGPTSTVTATISIDGRIISETTLTHVDRSLNSARGRRT